MIPQAKAKVYLSEERGLNETGCFRSQNTFNFGNYFNEHKQPFGDMYLVNDDILDGGRSLRMLIEENSYIILLPVIGAVKYKDSLGNKSLIAAGQVQVFRVDKGVTIEMANPFKEELVNFLQIWIKAGDRLEYAEPCVSTYDVNEFQNSLLQVSPQRFGRSHLPFIVSVGKFSGRGETVYESKTNDRGVFMFVIEGVFEAEGRLLHARDALALWDTREVEIEALSNDAILLLIETTGAEFLRVK
jgi:redox-sensitive bicupin YhaK (pirin superfamily)